jgi:hypothetical protein
MPRPRKPTTVLKLVGAGKKNPARLRERADEPIDNNPLGAPPKRLMPTERKIWSELQAELVEGVALASDRQAFEVLVRLLGMMRTNGIAAMEGAQLSQMNKLFTLFGMTPADRSRVKAPPKNTKKNPFAQRAG